MGLPRELVLHVLKTAPTHEEAVSLLEKYENVRERVLQRIKRIEKIKKDAADAVRKLKDEVICGHEWTKSHGDPSGGTDRVGECLICGQFIEQGGRFL